MEEQVFAMHIVPSTSLITLLPYLMCLTAQERHGCSNAHIAVKTAHSYEV